MRVVATTLAAVLLLGSGQLVAQEAKDLKKDPCAACKSACVADRPVPPGMALIPAGTFKMGCDEKSDAECTEPEKPLHDVYLSAYYIDVTEVTVADYTKCVEDEACTTAKSKQNNKYCNFGQKNKDDHPINCVEWLQGKNYCAWAGKRLPTAAEWEKAARGTDGRVYPWGKEKASCEFAIIGAESEGCGKPGTWPVCSKKKGNSPYGLCDTVGNLWEWVADWYEADYYKHSPDVNPPGPLKGTARVLRGGSWTSKLPESPRTTTRFFFKAGMGLGNFGFRCAMNAQ